MSPSKDAKEQGMLVATSVDEGIAMVRLTDGAHRNVLSPAMSIALETAVFDVVRQGARALVLSADPPVFCAGGSLDSLLERSVPLTEVYRGFVALANAPIPTVAAVAGAAIGAGVNLALCCDVILAAPSARFDPRFLDLGIHPGGGHLWGLQRRVGSQGAAAMVLMGDVLDGEESARAGLSWRCVPERELESAALALARRAARRDPELVARTKASLAASEVLCSFDEALALELQAQEWSMARPEFAEGVRRIRTALASRAAEPGDRVSKPEERVQG